MSDGPTEDGWYWVRLTSPYPEGVYMTLVRKGKHVYMFNADGRIPGGGRIEDVKRANGEWWGPLKPPF